MSATTQITIEQAFAIAKSETYDAALWEQAEKAIVKAKLCPHCACNGEKVDLGRREEGDYWHHAGRRCMECDEFIVCGEQPEYGDAADEWRGDADPGL